MNKFDLAEALIAIADTGSIYKAADLLHQTSAAISKKLSKLEAHLKTPLIHRERNGLRLTTAGQVYYHEAKKAVTQFAWADKSVANELVQPSGLLKVVAKQFYVQTLILPRLNDFLTRYPCLKIEFDATESMPVFDAKKMDILFYRSAVGPASADNLVRKKMDVSSYVLCATSTYLKRKGRPNSGTELLQHDFIAHSSRKFYELIVLDGEEQIITKPQLMFNNTELLIQAALSHLGFIWIDEKIVANLIAKKKLIRILEQCTQETTNIYLFYEGQYKLDPKIRAFVDYFSKEYSVS